MNFNVNIANRRIRTQVLDCPSPDPATMTTTVNKWLNMNPNLDIVDIKYGVHIRNNTDVVIIYVLSEDGNNPDIETPKKTTCNCCPNCGQENSLYSYKTEQMQERCKVCGQKILWNV